jgi:SAM-dependent methyltransferase
MEAIRMASNPHCLCCGTEGDSLYHDLPDRLFGVPGSFHFKICRACQLIWLDPRPAMEDMGKCYDNYYTHLDTCPTTDTRESRPLAAFRDALRLAILCGYYRYRHLHTRHVLCRLGPLLASFPYLKYRAVFDDTRERFPRYSARHDALLVDVGCGRGDFLKRMPDLRWNVLGIEPDATSAALAQKRGIPIIGSTLEEAQLQACSVDQITMQHVIEHLPDPVRTMNECFRILKQGGRLVIYTPNNVSLGHKVFGPAWRALEPPRHLHVFSPRSMACLFKKSPFHDIWIKTVSVSAAQIFDPSVLMSRQARIDGNIPVIPQRGRTAFAAAESFLCRLGMPYGEEVEAIAYRR